MKRYLIAAAVLLLCGMTLSSTRNITFVAIALLAVLAYMALYIHGKKYIALLFCFVVPIVGFAVLNIYISKIDNLTTPYYNTMCECEGRVVNFYTSDNFTCADVSVDSIKTYNAAYGGRRTVRLNVYGECDIEYGDVLNFHAVLERPAKYNLNGRNQRQFLLAKGIGLRASCGAESVSKIGSDFSYLRPRDLGYKIRTAITDRIDLNFSGDTAGFLKGLLTGDKSDLTLEAYSYFRTSGLAHIVAVSGMHVNILLGIMMCFFGLLYSKRRILPIFVYIVAVWLLALATGLSPSCVRAACMTTTMFAAWLVRRNDDSLTSLGIAVCIMLLANPGTFYDVGFRLSASSTAGILIFSDKMAEKLKFLPGTLGEFIAVYFASQIGIIPVSVYYFGTVSLTGLVSNIIVCPLLPVIMILEIITLALCKLQVIGAILVSVLKFATDAVLLTVRVLGSIPFASFPIGRIGAAGYLVYGLSVSGLYCFLKNLKKCALCFLLAAAFTVSVISASNFLRTDAEIAFLNVGSGDCAIVSAENLNIMVDGGGDNDYDIAENAVIPYMDRAGIARIDIALVSHYHEDHCLGLLTLMEHRRIKNIVLPLGIFEKELKERLELTAKRTGTKVLYIKSGDVLKGKSLTVTAFNTFTENNENNGMVYYFDYGKNRICFSGDVEESGEHKLLTQFNNVRCNILKVAHHGSTTSTTPEFVRAAMPSYAVISRSKACPQKTLDTLANCGAQVFSTAELGTVVLTINKDRIFDIKAQRSLDDEF